MLQSFSKSVLWAMALGAGLVLVGCQSDGTQSASGGAPSEQAVTCSKCQITWVKWPTDAGKGRIAGYYGRQRHECPDCKSAVENFFATGKLEHTCKTCGADSMQACERHW
jgi:hypothetical protein